MGINRKIKKVLPQNLDWHGSTKEIDKLLSESDYVLLACDLNETCLLYTSPSPRD